MEAVEINGKTYLVGLKWFAFDNKEDAKQKQKELGKGSGVLKVSDNLYLVYESPHKEKGYILASGFLDLASGYYYLNLDDGRKWILLKGSDGGILYEGIAKSFEEIEQKHYDLFIGFYDNLGRLKRDEITIQDGKRFRSTAGLDYRVYIAISVIVMIGFGLYMLTQTQPQQAQIQPQQAQLQQPTSPQQQQQEQQSLTFGTLDIDRCFNDFYRKEACDIKVEEKREKEINASCEDVLRKINSLVGKYEGELQWGESRQHGNYHLYSVSFSGGFLKKDLEFVKLIDFESADMKIEGGLLNPVVTIKGVLACK